MIENKQYLEMLDSLCGDFPYWNQIEGRTLLLTGASGMLGSLLVDAVMLHNEKLPQKNQCAILAVGRNRVAEEERFQRWLGSPVFTFLQHDVCEEFPELPMEPDFLIHAASTTHPVQYANEPVNTILANVLGTRNVLDVAARIPESRFLLLSSVEIYGENRGDVDYFDESYCGYLDCNTLRAGYPEGKRVSESLCQAYIQQSGVDAVILRLPRCYGPTMRMSDTKAVAQFIKKGIWKENIVLKSEGNQFYSYAFAADAVLGMLYALVKGVCGEAYNLADSGSDITLKELAALAAQCAGTTVIFDLPDEVELKGYSTATRAVLDAEKLKTLGWRPRYDIATGIRLTIELLQNSEGI